MRIAIGCDHGGFEVKQAVVADLEKRNLAFDDLGSHDTTSVDYPDYAYEVGLRVASGEADEGILVCTTGLGMDMMVNKFPRVRGALCMNAEMALKARTHNSANVLVLAGGLLEAGELHAILDAWFGNAFSEVERHRRRVNKIGSYSVQTIAMSSVLGQDHRVFDALAAEIERQQQTLNLIASENHVSAAVREAQGSVMTNKYAEGYPGNRWYNGCRYIDDVESLAIERACELFGAEHANVQPHCGSSANMAVYFTVLKPGDKILAMKLDHGGHLTHGHTVNFSGRLYKTAGYGVSEKDERLNLEDVERLARTEKPALIVVGASAYPRTLDFEGFRKIADRVDARLMVDMAHIAGLVAAGIHPNPVPFADFVTSTTHKTLRGPRGGLILCRDEYARALDKQVFPGIQGGPLMHAIASKAVCFHEAMQPAFVAYGKQIVANAQALAECLSSAGFRLVSGGTDNHLMLVDVSPQGLTGKAAATALEASGIVANKNVIPFDQESPFVTSGIRLGTPAVTTRGMKEPEMQTLGACIVRVLQNIEDDGVQASVRAEIEALAARFPVP